MDVVKGKLEKKKKRKIIIVVSVLVIGLSAGLVYYFLSKKEDNSNNDEEIVSFSTDTPSEDPPKECEAKEYQLKSIKIESIGVDGCMQSVGIDQNNRIAVPNNVHVAGWYVNSVEPGKEGLSIVTGHRDGIRTTGIFHELGKVKTGDRIEIEYGDGSKIMFKVVEVKQATTEQTSDLMYEKKSDIESQLTLITCGGKWNEKKKTYDDRIIVVAEGI